MKKLTFTLLAVAGMLSLNSCLLLKPVSIATDAVGATVGVAKAGVNAIDGQDEE